MAPYSLQVVVLELGYCLTFIDLEGNIWEIKLISLTISVFFDKT